MTDIIAEFWTYPLRMGDTLSSNEWIEWQFHRFLTSKFVTYAIHENRRADIGTAIILWSESYRQDPAGTLPDDDVQLAALARVASIEDWRAMRAGVLHGWTPCDIEDAPGAGRLGHAVIAKIAMDSHRRKMGRVHGREAAEAASARHKVKRKLEAMKLQRLADVPAVVEAVAKWLVQSNMYITDANVRTALEEAAGVPRVVDGGFGRTRT